MLPPLDAPHHLRYVGEQSQGAGDGGTAGFGSYFTFCRLFRSFRASEWFEFREGVVLGYSDEGESVCDIGLDRPALVKSKLPHGVRVTLHVGKEQEVVEQGGTEYIKSTVANPLAPTKYWGYSVRVARSIQQLFDECPFEGGSYDLRIGTSEKGAATDCCSLSLPDYRHALVVIGGPQGLEYLLANDELNKKHKEPSTLFDLYLNVKSDQGSRTIRTEEAMLMCLMYLEPALRK
jgi:predicted SPOUT superfamily RNA methylase MTH1